MSPDNPATDGPALVVTGGAGYIGSHLARLLGAQARRTLVIDDFSTGRRDAVPDGIGIAECDVRDTDRVARALADGADAVFHLASRIDVAESFVVPGEYYSNIVAGTLSLLEAMVRCGVNRLVYSSSAAVYGTAPSRALTESDATVPLSPYGRAKLAVEQILADYERAHGLQWVALRYFNAAGAHPDGAAGECHDPESHLIPLALRAASGRLPWLTVNGADYPTPDGTCVRDYVHVCDLATAHLLALDYLRRGGRSRAFNLGNGKGFSVAEVVASVERVTRLPVPVRYGSRRPGDSAVLLADASLARAELGWAPAYPAIDTMVAHAWAWERRLAGREGA